MVIVDSAQVFPGKIKSLIHKFLSEMPGYESWSNLAHFQVFFQNFEDTCVTDIQLRTLLSMSKVCSSASIPAWECADFSWPVLFLSLILLSGSWENVESVMNLCSG